MGGVEDRGGGRDLGAGYRARNWAIDGSRAGAGTRARARARARARTKARARIRS